jgi:hypothetical protein
MTARDKAWASAYLMKDIMPSVVTMEAFKALVAPLATDPAGHEGSSK